MEFILAIGALILTAFIYFLRTIIGWKKDNAAGIFVFNLFLGWTLIGCQQTEKTPNVIIDYGNDKILDSLISSTRESSDTIFLGLRMGMSKKQYVAHINQLKKSGKNITFSPSNKFSSVFSSQPIEIGSGYTFRTPIAIGQKKGFGEYVLQPIYSNGKIIKLNIFSFEDWSGIHSEEPDWLKENIESTLDSLIDPEFKRVLIKISELDENKDVWIRNNIIIYETIFGFTYMDKKAILEEIKMNQENLRKIKKDNKRIRF